MPPSAASYPDFDYTCKSNDIESSMGILDGTLYTWGTRNTLGILGRAGKSRKPLPAVFAGIDSKVHVKACFVGGTKDAGHSAALDAEGNLWLTGCDRWQQLGLGSSVGGAAGYTWQDGRLWQETFQRNGFVLELMRKKCGSGEDSDIKDVAIGGDHTVILANNQKDVFTFGKGSEGQLGIGQKPFVSTSVHSKELSSKVKGQIASVCAIRHCSFTIDNDGRVLKSAGKCRMDSELLQNALKDCREKTGVAIVKQ
uniref:Uncharacterized protein n=1 Tax=Chaetoceros debilis TaxID=122233 RepID=A0A7S3V4U3_9STRA|mmetsp:Transcript_3812/g.5714  ORF Transcript_3812/g.5714 Transcript_3812/m.5714 type:complete len:254 (-) Transcript_3812:39-800(-)|eukprot:CAMPEP_0194086790 /NCGR_PEP_ID=MMETSP0149-20130528/22458_1 /TAXON_ID=122233 /ORGANISM="Chaetoceros debilis, Strain MM31A-1" /LENGTH=253 /DNA_ID=CAMNT_0038769969 /DNA_START=17 /DNA_END=778 /DNA_ORIENTATION=+